MIALKVGKFYFVYGERNYVIDEKLAKYFPFPDEGEIVDVDEEGTLLLMPAIERAKRNGILLGIKDLILPSGKRIQVGTVGKSLPVTVDFFIDFIPRYVERIRRRISSDFPSQEKKTPTPFSW